MSQFETLTVYLFLAILNFVALTVSHPTTLEGTVALNKELKGIKTDINLLYKKLSELSAGTKKKKNDARSSSKDHNICLSKECIDASYQLLNNMDLNVDPCDDFYKFSCGNYIRETVIPDDKKKLTSFSPLEEIINNRARILLEESNDENSFETDKMTRKWYRACMNESQAEKLGVTPVLNSLKMLGGWPVLEDDDQNYTSFKWYEQVKKLNEEGHSLKTIMKHEIEADDKNSSYWVLRLDQPKLGLDREYLINGFNDKYVQYYYQYMIDAAVLLGANESRAISELKQSLMFEIKLANMSAPKSERRDKNKLYHPATLKELDDDKYDLKGVSQPSSWVDYFQTFLQGASQFNPGSKTEEGIVVDENEKIIIRNPQYFKDVLKLMNETDPKIIANYMAWRVVKTSMKYLNKAAQDIKQKYDKAKTGQEEKKATWKLCVKSSGFNQYEYKKGAGAASSMYVRRYFKPEEKEVMLEMIDYIRKSFKSMVDTSSWMDENTKIEAIKKLDKMGQIIAYANEIIDENLMENLHQGLELSSDHYYQNLLNRNKFWFGFDVNRLREKIDKLDWKYHQASAFVNAFYDPSLNAMNFPAGILQSMFFNAHRPMYMNFGGIGMAIGHEITHGFDDSGRRRDHSGELKDWWANSTAQEYKKRAKDIVHQYGNFTVKQVNLSVNGITTQGENIADIGGLKAAYLGYVDWVADKRLSNRNDEWEEETLPGLDLTQKQLFWVTYAQFTCEKFRDDALIEYLRTDPHSPGEFRLKGPVMNNPYFSEVFNCRLDSPMNPSTKFSVW